MTEITLFTLAPYLFLGLSVLLALSGRDHRVVLASTGVALVMALITGVIGLPAFFLMALAPVALFVWVNHFFANALRGLGFLVFIASALLMLSHKLPGLQNFKLFDQLVFNKASSAFDLYLNFDKVYLGVVLITLLPRLERQIPFKTSLGLVLKYYLVAVALLLPIAYGLGFVETQINTNPYVLVWALNNLMFVCFAEEVVFRRFIQNQLVYYFKNTQYGDLLAVFIGALLFGLAHFAGGVLYVLLATLAGIIYGLCFYHTCNVRSSMALHFAVNLTHALFFTYPFAASWLL